MTPQIFRPHPRSNRNAHPLIDIDIDLTERRANLESTDLQEVISRVQSQLLQLEAAQSAYARINQQTLFDLIS